MTRKTITVTTDQGEQIEHADETPRLAIRNIEAVAA